MIGKVWEGVQYIALAPLSFVCWLLWKLLKLVYPDLAARLIGAAMAPYSVMGRHNVERK